MPNPVGPLPQVITDALIWLQAWSIAHVNPGRLMPGEHAESRRWVVKKLPPAAIITALATVQQEDAKRWYRVFPEPEAGRFESWYLTPFMNWLDKQTVAVTQKTAAEVELAAHSGSTCIAPAWVPFTLVLGVFFAFVPFKDFGKNHEHLDELKAAVIKAGGEVSEEEITRRGKTRKAE